MIYVFAALKVVRELVLEIHRRACCLVGAHFWMMLTNHGRPLGLLLCPDCGKTKRIEEL